MKPADDNRAPLPRYGLGDEDKTRPCVVLFDWNGDDEPTVRVSAVELRAALLAPPPRAYIDDLDGLEELDEFDVKAFRPRWHGIGRRPGAVALAVVLGVSLVIGAFALLGSGETEVEAAGAGAPPPH